MAIKKLQNAFTTREQSKRLLELGVPADSADCYYRNWDCLLEHPSTDTSKYIHIRKTQIEREACYMHFAGNLPCWSLGRLMEIFDICYPQSDTACWPPHYELDTDYITYVVRLYERGIMELDFSKLEE